ncbi:AAA family ATPase [Hymenobacter fodinae]|uniref:Adenylate kinase n=1 Tax=Hymenobacter fodinae TaxID=2510796 RepID=A0A4Z0P1B9_9BACT|nr:shikimate kinase [Hymenobacter fodinae]TGE04823.1 adenylate kinase [Hymenobacter fodinae]
MKVHIVGASGAGSTTLGTALAPELNVPYFDTDTYFWESTDPPFRVRRPVTERNAQLLQDLAAAESWVLGGSLLRWELPSPLAFDLVVFLWVPPALRMQRLAARELARYGPVIFQDEERNTHYRELMEWAAGYDEGTGLGRSLRTHEQWLRSLTCPVLEIRGDTTVADRVRAVTQEIRRLSLR